jgi:hypothetical protein
VELLQCPHYHVLVPDGKAVRVDRHPDHDYEFGAKI